MHLEWEFVFSISVTDSSDKYCSYYSQMGHRSIAQTLTKLSKMKFGFKEASLTLFDNSKIRSIPICTTENLPRI